VDAEVGVRKFSGKSIGIGKLNKIKSTLKNLGVELA